MDGLAGRVREDLHLNVTGPHDGLLEEHRGIAECAVCLAHCLFESAPQFFLGVNPAHSASPAARDGLGEYGEADLIRPRQQLFDVLGGRCRQEHRNARLDRVLLCRDLIARHLEHVRGRTDEGDARVRCGLGQVRILREEAVPGVDCVSPGFLGNADDLAHVKIRPNRVTLLADLVRLVGLETMHGVAILVGEDGHGLCAQFKSGPHRPNRDLAAVGYENFREHSFLSHPHHNRAGKRWQLARDAPIWAHDLGSLTVVKVSSLLVHVLSVSSLKGGVGKTTVTLGLASAAFARGLRTLVVDLDPQSDVSTGMDIDVAGHLNIADVLASPKEKIVRAAIAPSGWTKGRPGKVEVLIGSPSAINFDGPHPSIRDIWKLEEALANVEADYDLVLIDCAPSLNALTRTAWAASDRVTIVTEPGLFSVAAADRALRAIEEIRRGLSPRLQPLGIIVNRLRVQSLEHQFRIKELRDMFGPLVLSPQLPERTSLQQAQGAAKPLHVWPGESAQEMARNFDQLLERVMRTARIGEFADDPA